MSLILDGTNGLSDVDGTAATPAIRGTDTNTGIFFPAADTIAFSEGGTESARFNASGNLGIGTTNPTSSLVVSGAATGVPTVDGVHLGIQSGFATIELCGSSATGSLIDFTKSGSDAPGRILYENVGNFMSFGINNAERMRIDSSGNLLVNRTSALSAGQYSADFDGNSRRGIVLNNSSGTTGANLISFASSGSVIASITQPTASTVAYNTSSDYRLKENIAPMTGALAKVSALKPVTYKWKVDGSDGQGFIAHELQEVVPDCVSGEKDAVDAEGNPVYQGIDTSFLVATLTAAIQELKATVDAQAARIAALENPPVES